MKIYHMFSIVWILKEIFNVYETFLDFFKSTCLPIKSKSTWQVMMMLSHRQRKCPTTFMTHCYIDLSSNCELSLFAHDTNMILSI